MLNRPYRIPAKLILDASETTGGVTLLAAKRSRHFNVSTTGNLTAVWVTFAGGRVVNHAGHAFGGSMYIDGGVGDFRRCTFVNNSAVATSSTSTAVGGAIQNGRFPVSAQLGAALTMTECLITNNWIRGGREAYGGAIYTTWTSVSTYTGCTWRRNRAVVNGTFAWVVSKGG
jgi:hypothetical protein